MEDNFVSEQAPDTPLEEELHPISRVTYSAISMYWYDQIAQIGCGHLQDQSGSKIVRSPNK